jgi:hypothetical protein
MTDAFQMPLDSLQPSQLYISVEKLCKVMAAFASREFGPLAPIPIVRRGDRILLTDGHTRAFAAWSSGRDQVPVVWDPDKLDWEAYDICVAWCEQEGIRTVADLEDRVVDAATYQALWLDRCTEMHRALERKRDRDGRKGQQSEWRRRTR